ncbi:hypothetical protein A3D71_03620 [Candidatus Kaiserbacteria bacterium RIFCSPHIGHO2_02_FULL_55_20]|uniref:Uncharacterized protein n=1 Tax=Candidatus Kaiserbacteria bacterium RIFCSPHIGHO2_02_FULL_55_20 TaxID=1798497 RepID=A0A1F6DV91_9BACT|nr:MAG: hypothetical protein A2680_04675 [Candidatus Kaiserbacteria bacterium RIFCSPHIGHO2_01_FULL_55_37]OGG65303.1 MAG: hypothetical protein A3D71_03620 [Candidatus Kaiserbacteria bacterium RIFCSPHIGHO2_02_FULL_55_20]
MLPSSNPAPFNPADHLLPASTDTSQGGPPAPKSSAGPVVGIIIIVMLLVVGALYFWGAHLNAQNLEDQLPLIPGDSPSSST